MLWDFFIWPQFLHLTSLGRDRLIAARLLPLRLVLIRRFGSGVMGRLYMARTECAMLDSMCQRVGGSVCQCVRRESLAAVWVS